jgi:hypothetical protein
MQSGVNFAVCDAGGSTVDTTLYHVEDGSRDCPLKIEIDLGSFEKEVKRLSRALLTGK